MSIKQTSLLLSIFLLLFIGELKSQNNIGFQWQRTFSGTNGQYGKAITRTTDGGFVISGQSIPTPPNFLSDMWIAKYNSTGALVWQKKYGAAGGGYNTDIIQTSDGGYLVLGYVSGSGGYVAGFKGGSDIWLLKLDASGNFVWQRCLGGTYYESASSVVQTADGSYVIAGSTNSKDGDVVGKTDSLNRDVWIVKVNSTGSSIVWQKIFKGLKEEEANDMQLMKNGDLIITGYTKSNDSDFAGNGNGDSSKNDLFLIRLSGNGSTVWKKMFHNYDNDNGQAVMELPDSSLIIAGTTHINNPDNKSGWIIKTKPDGSYIWDRKINTIAADTFLLNTAEILFNSIDKGLVLGGFASGRDYVENASIVKTDSLGNAEWRKTFIAPSGLSEFNSIILNDDFTVIATGAVYPSGPNYGLLFKVGPTNILKGTVFLDANLNGTKDLGEQNFNNAILKSQKGSSVITGQPQNGAFKFDVDTGSYTTTVQLFNPYYNFVPSSRNTNFTTYFNVDSFGFAIQPIPNKQDLQINLVPLSPARPGFKAQYVLTYKNVGTTTIANGSVKLIKDSRTTLSVALPVPSAIIADTLTWNYSNLKPLDSMTIGIEFQLAAPPALNINDTLRYAAVILPVAGDLTPADDTSSLRQRVQGSYDPNDKQESFAGKIPLKSVQDGAYINYVIRFQNTGNDTAFFVRLLDTLDAKLDWASFQMIGSSHAYNLTIKDGNKLNWFFDNIKLPDSTTNLARSIGYVAFRIKPKNNLAANQIISNKASIYFDYNLPIVTNTTNTIVSVETTTAVREVQNDEMKMKLGPNPSNGYSVLQISGKLKGKFELRMIDANGRIISQQTITRNSTGEIIQLPLNLQQLSSGVYIIQLQQKEKSWWQKVVVQ